MGSLRRKDVGLGCPHCLSLDRDRCRGVPRPRVTPGIHAGLVALQKECLAICLVTIAGAWKVRIERRRRRILDVLRAR